MCAWSLEHNLLSTLLSSMRKFSFRRHAHWCLGEIFWCKNLKCKNSSQCRRWGTKLSCGFIGVIDPFETRYCTTWGGYTPQFENCLHGFTKSLFLLCLSPRVCTDSQVSRKPRCAKSLMFAKVSSHMVTNAEAASEKMRGFHRGACPYHFVGPHGKNCGSGIH